MRAATSGGAGSETDPAGDGKHNALGPPTEDPEGNWNVDERQHPGFAFQYESISDFKTNTYGGAPMLPSVNMPVLGYPYPVC